MAKKKGKLRQLWLDFKKFISRGSVVDMAIGVVIGGAFSAIVTSFTSILMSICTWAIPGGINGLVTVLPAMGANQTFSVVVDGSTISYNFFSSSELAAKAAQAGLTEAELLSKFTLYGDLYVYNGAAIINWGAVINAIISFIIIALTLFIILKVYSSLKANKAKLDARMLEEYYKKHPEERPVEAAPTPKEPTEKDYLRDIANSLKGSGRTKAGRRHF
jgi:large conductance mechanosensitive channel